MKTTAGGIQHDFSLSSDHEAAPEEDPAVELGVQVPGGAGTR